MEGEESQTNHVRQKCGIITLCGATPLLVVVFGVPKRHTNQAGVMICAAVTGARRKA